MTSNASLEDLIPVVNRLQDLVFHTIGSDTLDLPQVVVVGSQSCGKSSVLENIVGRDFLPRGTGIVTRRPLILQLINIPNQQQTDTSDTNKSSFELAGSNTSSAPNPTHVQSEEWGEFLHIPDHKYYDFSQIRREIERETDRVAGTNKGVNRTPINLKIYSPHVLNLTLVDLPGLMKIPVGDQPTDIERQTRNLILEYIAKPNAIILAVSPANVDLVNSESLKLARKVDPQGKRTIGVLSKLDLMDNGTNALDILSGNVYPLKLGFIGVVNRSQQDIHSNKSLKDSLEAEKEFFQNHPAYRNIAHKCGTPYLAKQLNQTLMNHIRERLPDIKAKLNTLMGQTEQELASYGNVSLGEPDNKSAVILQLMTSFATNFVAAIEGTSSAISTKELFGGARIYYIFNKVFGTSLSTLDPTRELSLHDIRTAIRNCTGPRPSLFVPELAFDLLVKPQIGLLLEPPSQRCVQLVYEELMKIVHNCSSVELERYPKLQAKLIEVISDLLRERLGPTSTYVTSLISIQKAYINTDHPNFIGAANAMASIMDEQRRLSETSAPGDPLAIEEDVIVDGPIMNGSGAGHKSSTSSTKSEPSNGSSLVVPQSTQHSASFGGSAQASNKDTFLNYLFGKDSEMPATGADAPLPILANGRNGSFNNGAGGLPAVLDEPISKQDLVECELIRRLILSYFGIVRDTIQDQVPKAVMHLLVNFSKDEAQTRLVRKLYKESLFDELLYEDEGLAEEREKCIKMLKTYKEAAKIIGEVV